MRKKLIKIKEEVLVLIAKSLCRPLSDSEYCELCKKRLILLKKLNNDEALQPHQDILYETSNKS